MLRSLLFINLLIVILFIYGNMSWFDMAIVSIIAIINCINMFKLKEK